MTGGCDKNLTPGQQLGNRRCPGVVELGEDVVEQEDGWMVVPVGEPVHVTLTSPDVVHSFYVPIFLFKRDAIPGRTNTFEFTVEEEGTYRGQCAEFCGYQHAFMAFEVIAEPPEQYEAWAEQQRREAGEPSDPRGQRGKAVFLGSTCVMCHTIQGTDANAIRGPDLTHVAGRERIAAVSMVAGSSTQISIRSKPRSFTLSMRSRVLLEKGDVQMNVLAPNCMAGSCQGCSIVSRPSLALDRTTALATATRACEP